MLDSSDLELNTCEVFIRNTSQFMRSDILVTVFDFYELHVNVFGLRHMNMSSAIHAVRIYTESIFGWNYV